MPALNFKKQFAPDVESGKKRQTIRAYRKDGRDPKPGDQLYHYTGMRTKACRHLCNAVCESVTPIRLEAEKIGPYIDHYQVIKGRVYLSPTSANALAKADGFETAEDFFKFFEKTHGLPFNGLLIKW